jgi:ABC-2 type transport system ATP-binding protein
VPDAGTVSILGEPAGSPAARLALGWVPQDLALYPRLTCRENLDAFGRYQGLRGTALRAAVDRCLDWAALAERAGDRVAGLSEGISILYTTHYMEEAERLCDRIAVVDHGRVIAEGARDRLVRDAFGTRSEVLVRFEDPDGPAAVWTRERGGRLDGGVARFEIEHAADIGGLLEGAARAGHEVVDVSLRKPNLESVFLHLTGRELRE